jgi:hypothetical protein
MSVGVVSVRLPKAGLVRLPKAGLVRLPKAQQAATQLSVEAVAVRWPKALLLGRSSLYIWPDLHLLKF